MTGGPAYRIETGRLVIRCWDPRDARVLERAVVESVEHLKPWMPWASEEPITLDARVDLLRRFRGNFDLGTDFIYGIFDREETQVLGGTGLHTRRGPQTREIGYWIHGQHINHGLATESSEALVKVAFEVDKVVRVEIRCDPGNRASAAIPQKLGFTREGLLRGDTDFRGVQRDTEVWGLLSGEYADSPAARAEIRAYNALGQRLLPEESQ